MAGSERPLRKQGGSSSRAEGELRIGVLALQGAFREHVKILGTLGAVTSEVRLPGQLVGLDGLVIPGGESTTMGLLMETYGLMDPLREFARTRPVFGTCAGLIMLAKQTTDGGQPLLGVMDITVRRNAFGRQLRSFEASVELNLGEPAASSEAAGAETGGAGADSMRGVFIRAPWVEEMGPEVEVVARCDEHVVGVRQDNMLGVAFHPELGDDTKLHEYFLEMVRAATA